MSAYNQIKPSNTLSFLPGLCFFLPLKNRTSFLPFHTRIFSFHVLFSPRTSALFPPQDLLPSRMVSVHEFRIVKRDGNMLEFYVRCSKGTYIRSLANDLGEALGVGAHLVALRRVSIGPFSVMESWSVEAVRLLPMR